MWFTIKTYLKFLWLSKNEHAVHSPFVYTLITNCFYDNKAKKEYAVLKTYRKSLLENKNIIEVTDFGAGSKVFKSSTREITKIAQTAGISSKRAELLFRVTSYFQPKHILEIGTSLGLATTALSLGNRNAKIITVEGCANTIAVAKNLLETNNSATVEFINMEFEAYFKNTSFTNVFFDLIYFDGNHQKQATLYYFDKLLPTITNDTVWIFDDIHWSQEMEEAWKIIQNHPKVTVTIDTFQWGFVFFRREQPKEHFIIRV